MTYTPPFVPPDGDPGPAGPPSMAPPSMLPPSMLPPSQLVIPHAPGGAPVPPPGPRKSGSSWRIVVAVVLVVALLGVGLGALFLLARRRVEDATADYPSGLQYPSGPGGLVDGVSPEHHPADESASSEAIRGAMARAFDPSSTPEQWTAAVDAPVAVGEKLRTLAPRCGLARPDVLAVSFVSDDAATVTFTLTGSKVPGAAMVTFSGTAERTEGHWMISRYTIDKVILNADSYCPH